MSHKYVSALESTGLGASGEVKDSTEDHPLNLRAIPGHPPSWLALSSHKDIQFSYQAGIKYCFASLQSVKPPAMPQPDF